MIKTNIRILPCLVTAILLTSSVSCERDDICPGSTPTTPSLIIDAYDKENLESSKNIFGLFIVGVGQSEALPGYVNVSSSELILPLDTNSNRTEYQLVRDSFINDNGTPDDSLDDFVDGNYDLIIINYSVREVYVSRACGYKYIFENVTVQLDQNDTDPWIESIQPLNPNQSVENETETHFNLYH